MQVTSTGCSIEHDNISVIMLSCRLRPLSLFSPEVKLIPRKQRPTLSDAGNSPLLEVGSSAPSVPPPPVLLDLLEAGAGVYRGSKNQDRDKYRPLPGGGVLFLTARSGLFPASGRMGRCPDLLGRELGNGTLRVLLCRPPVDRLEQFLSPSWRSGTVLPPIMPPGGREQSYIPLL